MYGQNGDCFYSHVAGRSLIGPLCPGRTPILKFHAYFITWGADRIHLKSGVEMKQKGEPRTGY
jgi:hypothetical protein